MATYRVTKEIEVIDDLIEKSKVLKGQLAASKENLENAQAGVTKYKAEIKTLTGRLEVLFEQITGGWTLDLFSTAQITGVKEEEIASSYKSRFKFPSKDAKYPSAVSLAIGTEGDTKEAHDISLEAIYPLLFDGNESKLDQELLLDAVSNKLKSLGQVDLKELFDKVKQLSLNTKKETPLYIIKFKFDTEPAITVDSVIEAVSISKTDAFIDIAPDSTLELELSLAYKACAIVQEQLSQDVSMLEKFDSLSVKDLTIEVTKFFEEYNEDRFARFYSVAGDLLTNTVPLSNVVSIAKQNTEELSQENTQDDLYILSKNQDGGADICYQGHNKRIGANIVDAIQGTKGYKLAHKGQVYFVQSINIHQLSQVDLMRLYNDKAAKDYALSSIEPAPKKRGRPSKSASLTA